MTEIGKEDTPELVWIRRREDSESAQPELPLPAINVGVALRSAREATHRSLAEIALHLRIAERHLAAIESGNLEALPGITYAVGFVRSYAHFLDLNTEDLVHQFKQEMGIANSKPTLNFPIPANHKALPGGALALFSLILIAAIYGGWYYANSSDSTSSSIQPVATLKSPAASSDSVSASIPSSTPLPTESPSFSSPIASSAPSDVMEDRVFSPPSEAAIETPAMRALPPSGLTSVPSRSSETPSIATTTSPIEALASPVNPALIKSKIVLRASQETWIQILDTTNAVVFSRLLQSGETYPVPDQNGLRLDTGNAGGLEILVEGRVLPSLGANGTVRRDIPLDVTKLNTLYPIHQ
ncbi:MAG: DUF4115 domain-containing protein [Alphaproteobacteria bacterium]